MFYIAVLGFIAYNLKVTIILTEPFGVNVIYLQDPWSGGWHTADDTRQDVFQNSV